MKSKRTNAATGGSTKPYIYITSALVEKLPAELIGTVLAHECGHIACRHNLYHSMIELLIDGIDNSPLSWVPAVRRLITPAMEKALLLWYRCSELSADRAAALCDGSEDKTISVLLRIYGYENVNQEEFLKQAVDLHAFIEESESHKLIEQMLIQDDEHPQMTTRAYECKRWTENERFQSLIHGTYLPETAGEEYRTGESETEIARDSVNGNDLDALNKELRRVNAELERYTSAANRYDYAAAMFSGLASGVIDAMYVGEIIITDRDIELSYKQVEEFVKRFAEKHGLKGDHLSSAVVGLEKTFEVAQDNVWKGKGINVSAKNHHLADLAHHPTPLGLLAAIVVHFLKVGVFVNKNGKFHIIPTKDAQNETAEVLAPVIITAIMNWLVCIAEKCGTDEEHEIPAALLGIVHLIATTPLIVEFVKCVNNWFGHQVSDMAGSGKTAGGGMGIPGVFVSLLYEFAALPIMKDTGLPGFLNDLYENKHFDLRHEIPFYKAAGKQAIPMLINELCVRVSFFISRLAAECQNHPDLVGINWQNVIPYQKRTVDQMLAIAQMTFNIADTADAAVHAAVESAGNWILFSGRFVARINHVGIGRTALTIVKEVSSEHKEVQLLHEKLILSEAKTEVFLDRLQVFKAQLEDKVASYLAENIEIFIGGLDTMDQGLAAGDSDLVIKGNAAIQRALGGEMQFTNQEEFDELMGSDTPFML